MRSTRGISSRISRRSATKSWPWSGGAGNFYTLNWSLTADTAIINGLDLLSPSNFGLGGFFGSAGVDCFTIPSLGSLGFLTLFLQVVVVDPGTGAVVGASDVGATTFL